MGDGINRSGGGIVFGGDPGPRGAGGEHLGRDLRRRWASGIAIVLVANGLGGFRGITATSFMVASEEPPAVALAVFNEGEFGDLLTEGVTLSVSVLEAGHEFLAERFAGRAPLPDAALTGIGYWLAGDLPVIEGAMAWCVGQVTTIQPVGDHRLVLANLTDGGLGEDTDDPLLRYEGRYRRLEAG